LAKEVSNLVEAPTFGAWFSLAKRVLQEIPDHSFLTQNVQPFLHEKLTPFLYGTTERAPETAFVDLRNRLAHGGGLSSREAQRLLGIWQERFAKEVLSELLWIEAWQLWGFGSDQAWVLLSREAEKTEGPVGADAPADAQPGSLWLRWNGEQPKWLHLWPLALFGKITFRSEERSRASDTDHAQVYSRAEHICLSLTPLESEGFALGHSGDEEFSAFRKLFQLDECRSSAQEKGFEIQGFEEEIAKDLKAMVGREKESAQLFQSVTQKESGLWWVAGAPGMGKSFVMARLYSQLREAGASSQRDKLVFAYRFRAAESRCSRQAFATFLAERLAASGAWQEGTEIPTRGKPAQQIQQCLVALRPGVSLHLLLDGMDEIARTDSGFIADLAGAFDQPGVCWVLAGREEEPVVQALQRLEAESVFTDGLPPMSKDDIRGMILEKIGSLRKKLLLNDREEGDDVINPFIDLAVRRAQGLPIYIRYLIGDIISGKYRMLDGHEDLPENLQAYYEELLRRLGIGDLQNVLTPLVCTLATAHEPLSEEELREVLVFRKILQDGDSGRELLHRGLGAVQSMLRQAPNAGGQKGFTLYHASMCEHILQSATANQSVALSRDAWADLAEQSETYPEGLSKYLWRNGIEHLIESDRKSVAIKILASLASLTEMMGNGVSALQVFKWWKRTGESNIPEIYANAICDSLAASSMPAAEGKKILGCFEFFFESSREAFLFYCGYLAIAKVSERFAPLNDLVFETLAEKSPLDRGPSNWIDGRVLSILTQALAAKEKEKGVQLFGQKVYSEVDSPLSATQFSALETLRSRIVDVKDMSNDEIIAGEFPDCSDDDKAEILARIAGEMRLEGRDEAAMQQLEPHCNRLSDLVGYPASLHLAVAWFLINPDKYRAKLDEAIALGSTISYYYWNAKSVENCCQILLRAGFKDEAIRVGRLTNTLDPFPSALVFLADEKFTDLAKILFAESLSVLDFSKSDEKMTHRVGHNGEADLPAAERAERIRRKSYPCESQKPEALADLAEEFQKSDPQWAVDLIEEAIQLVNPGDRYAVHTLGRIYRQANACELSDLAKKILEKACSILRQLPFQDAIKGWSDIIAITPEVLKFSNGEPWDSFCAHFREQLSNIDPNEQEQPCGLSRDVGELIAGLAQCGECGIATDLLRLLPFVPEHPMLVRAGSLQDELLELSRRMPESDRSAFDLLLEIAESDSEPYSNLALDEALERRAHIASLHFSNLTRLFKCLLRRSRKSDAEDLIPLMEDWCQLECRCDLIAPGDAEALDKLLALAVDCAALTDPHSRGIVFHHIKMKASAILKEVAPEIAVDSLVKIMASGKIPADDKTMIVSEWLELHQAKFDDLTKDKLRSAARDWKLPITLQNKLECC
jgi:hypothetical protein